MLSAPRASAQGSYPSRTDPYINDYAQIISVQDAGNIRKVLTDLKSGKGTEVVVVTINSIHDYNTGDTTIEAFATHLFNAWGIGDAKRNDGVMLLVAVKDRDVRVELGAGYGSGYSPEMQAIIDKYMLPEFRNGAYSSGIFKGTQAIIAKLTGGQPPDAGQTASTPAQTGAASNVSQPARSTTANTSAPGYVVAILLITITGVVIASFGLSAIARNRRRRCPNCRQWMIRLDEAADDSYLDSGQKTEEQLASADYDVWKCPNCGTHTLLRYGSRYGPYEECPQCHYQTLEVITTVLKYATDRSTGKQQITRKCHNCAHYEQEIVILPVLTQASDRDYGLTQSSNRDRNRSLTRSSDRDYGSRDRDSGGGSSSGGGASGKW